MQRRNFLRLASSSAAGFALPRVGKALRDAGGQSLPPIVDSHIHLFDPTRPGGVPWPEKDDTVLYKPATPDRYETLSAPLGIVGCIAVEASPLASDNDWLLGIALNHPVVLGIIGDLVPGAPTYLSELERLHQNSLFLGIRYGNLWHRDLATDLAKPGFIEGLKALSQTGLVLESANPDSSLIRALLQTAAAASDLRIVVDHLPNATLPSQGADLDEYHKNLHTLAQHPNIFVKLSEIPLLHDGKLIQDPSFYRDRIDTLWNLFGEDRVIFGSDWPNSDHIASFADTFGIVREYISQKPRAAQEKYFWRNSARVYRWKPRRPNQPRL